MAPPEAIPFVDLKAQYAALRESSDARIRRVLDHGQYVMGPEVRELEERLEAWTGAKHCVTVASGTEALLISLMALGVKPGDEVVTTPFTFVAPAEMIVLLGAKPVFVARGGGPGRGRSPASPPTWTRSTRSRRGTGCRSSRTRRRASARPTRAERAATSPRSAAPASIPPSRSAATATAGRFSRATTRSRRPRARSACTAIRAATGTRASGSAGAWARSSGRRGSGSREASGGGGKRDWK